MTGWSSTGLRFPAVLNRLKNLSVGYPAPQEGLRDGMREPTLCILYTKYEIYMKIKKYIYKNLK